LDLQFRGNAAQNSPSGYLQESLGDLQRLLDRLFLGDDYLGYSLSLVPAKVRSGGVCSGP
jgi:hypothetical protein